MKSIFTLLLFLSLGAITFAQTSVDVSTGEGYANEVYYSLENDVLKSVARDSWDIAFTSAQMSVSVQANNGAGVMLYTWNKGNSDSWASVDTTGMDWTPMYNSIEDWEYGALNANTETGNDFDYGWGKYNMISHTITGDSIFIIKLPNDQFKKLLIKQKNAIQNVWTFQYADLDGQNDTTVTLDAKNYKSTSFIHYSIRGNAVVEQEPAERWQLLFTRYFDYNIPYYVTGILANSGVKVQQVNGVSQDDFKDYQTDLFNDTISEIGSDWKSFSMASFTYVVAPDVVYFVQDATGTYSFVKEKMNATSVNDISERNLGVYPNPASNEINVIHDFKGDTEFSVYNLAGQLVLQTKNYESAGLNKQILDISSIPVGMYTLQVRSGNNVNTVKFLKR
jgi:hypothetical protein